VLQGLHSGGESIGDLSCVSASFNLTSWWRSRRSTGQRVHHQSHERHRQTDAVRLVWEGGWCVLRRANCITAYLMFMLAPCAYFLSAKNFRFSHIIGGSADFFLRATVYNAAYTGVIVIRFPVWIEMLLRRSLPHWRRFQQARVESKVMYKTTELNWTEMIRNEIK